MIFQLLGARDEVLAEGQVNPGFNKSIYMTAVATGVATTFRVLADDRSLMVEDPIQRVDGLVDEINGKIEEMSR